VKPDGLVVFHLSNRHLDLVAPAQAAARAAGGYALRQHYEPDRTDGWESSEDALAVARTPQALAALAADPRWRPADAGEPRPWTDDYTNLAGALWRRMRPHWAG